MLGGWYTQRKYWSSEPLPLDLALCISSICFFLSCIIYNKAVIIRRVLSWVILVNYETWRGKSGMGTTEFVVSWAEMWAAHIFHLSWCLQWGWSYEIESLTCKVYTNSRQLVSELNWIVGHPVDVKNWRICCCQNNIFDVSHKKHILPDRFFVDKTNIFLKFVWKGKGSRIAKTILKTKNEMGGISLSNFKPYYIATIIKLDSTGRDIDTQLNGTEENQK